jgi:hypothetical protein
VLLGAEQGEVVWEVTRKGCHGTSEKLGLMGVLGNR